MRHGILAPRANGGCCRAAAVGSRVKYLVDTPEMIWGCLDTKDFHGAVRRFLRCPMHTPFRSSRCLARCFAINVISRPVSTISDVALGLGFRIKPQPSSYKP